jgi:hypothetical protein
VEKATAPVPWKFGRWVPTVPVLGTGVVVVVAVPALAVVVRAAVVPRLGVVVLVVVRVSSSRPGARRGAPR